MTRYPLPILRSLASVTSTTMPARQPTRTSLPATRTTIANAGSESFMAREVRTDPLMGNHCAAAQHESAPGVRKCAAVDPRAELLELAETGPVTIPRIMDELGWSRSRAYHQIERAKAKGELVPTGRGCVRRTA